MKWRNVPTVYASRLQELRDMPPHELLGVTPSASADEIKGAYREKVKIYHPDRADEFMKNYGESIVALLNDAKRKLLESR